MKTDFIQIAGYAFKALSGHNTQSWKFHITDNTITYAKQIPYSPYKKIETLPV